MVVLVEVPVVILLVEVEVQKHRVDTSAVLCMHSASTELAVIIIVGDVVVVVRVCA